jgi:cyclopropane fatty-acyl-phospholipid synthase-like methyltransferase
MIPVMCFGKTQFDTSFVKGNMMGPNAIRMIEELAKSLKLEKGMRVLDLGCGKGLTSIFLAKEFGVTVFATDLWISASENYERFKAMGVEDKIIPIHAEAHDLPFAQEYFDVAVCVDAYHYFGVEPDYLEKHLAPLVKKGGQIAVAVPGLKEEFAAGVPAGLVPYWCDDMKNTLHSRKWWQDLWKGSTAVSTGECKEMNCFKEAWQDWLTCDSDFARRDIGMMDAGGWEHFNLVAMAATKIRG